MVIEDNPIKIFFTSGHNYMLVLKRFNKEKYLVIILRASMYANP